MAVPATTMPRCYYPMIQGLRMHHLQANLALALHESFHEKSSTSWGNRNIMRESFRWSHRNAFFFRIPLLIVSVLPSTSGKSRECHNLNGVVAPSRSTAAWWFCRSTDNGKVLLLVSFSLAPADQTTLTSNNQRRWLVPRIGSCNFNKHVHQPAINGIDGTNGSKIYCGLLSLVNQPG